MTRPHVLAFAIKIGGADQLFNGFSRLIISRFVRREARCLSLRILLIDITLRSSDLIVTRLSNSSSSRPLFIPVLVFSNVS